MTQIKRPRSPGAKVIDLPTREYLVRVTLLVRQLHHVVAACPEEAEKLAPDAKIVGDVEVLDIIESVPIERVR